MSRKSVDQIPMAFSDERKCTTDWLQCEQIIEDRGSRYSVTGGKVLGKEDVLALIKKLKENPVYANATHNTWAARIEHENAVFEIENDDGETGAGKVILYMMRKKQAVNCMVVVTRWFGGIKLETDRYKHVQDATRYWISEHFDKP